MQQVCICRKKNHGETAFNNCKTYRIREQEEWEENYSVSFGESSKSKDTQFAEDLCSGLISADIPLYKMRNKNFVSFLETYREYKVPSETTPRNNYVKDLYKTLSITWKNA